MVLKKMEILKTVLWQKRYWCENAFDVPYFIFWLVRNASWMKSINFKCLTTAISVDCWRELRQCTLLRRKKKKGRTHYVLETKPHQIIEAKTTFDRWNQLITAIQWRAKCHKTSRVDDNNDASKSAICTNRREWIEMKNCYSFIYGGERKKTVENKRR